MTNLCFRTEMKRLEAAYNYNMPQEQANIYWEKLRHIEDSSFSEIVEELICSSHRFPAISVILDSIKAKPYHRKTEEEKRRELEDRRIKAENEWA